MAINQVNVGNVHAIAHQLGGKYGIPHGLANSLVLPHVLEFSREETATRLAELAQLIGIGSPGDSIDALSRQFIEAVLALREEVGIAGTTDKLKKEDFADIALDAIKEGATYPVPRLLDRESVDRILGRIAA